MSRDLEKLYDDVVQTTENFKSLKPQMIAEKPNRLLIFRLLLNTDQRTIARMLNKSQGTIYAIEKGLRKSVDLNDATKIIEETKKVEQIPTKEILLKRLSEIANRGTFNGVYAKIMSLKASKERSIKGAVLKEPTKQENTLIRKLNEQKTPFQFHGVIEASRKFVVDFAFPSEKNPKVILEMKELKLDYRKRQMAIELAYRAIKIRQKYPQIKLITVIDGNLQEEAIKIIKEEYDRVLINSPLDDVLKTIKFLMGSLM